MSDIFCNRHTKTLGLATFAISSAIGGVIIYLDLNAKGKKGQCVDIREAFNDIILALIISSALALVLMAVHAVACKKTAV